MDVDGAGAELLAISGGKDPHIPGQHDQIRLGLVQMARYRLLLAGAAVGLPGVDRLVMERDAKPGSRRAEVGLVGDDADDLGGQIAGGTARE